MKINSYDKAINLSTSQARMTLTENFIATIIAFNRMFGNLMTDNDLSKFLAHQSKQLDDEFSVNFNLYAPKMSIFQKFADDEKITVPKILIMAAIALQKMQGDIMGEKKFADFLAKQSAQIDTDILSSFNQKVQPTKVTVPGFGTVPKISLLF